LGQEVLENSASDQSPLYSPLPLYSLLIEQAARMAATAHHDQRRKITGVPYFSHPSSVTLILARAGFTEDTILAAALLHDVVEDTSITLADLQNDFPTEVVDVVDACSEQKRDSAGSKIPWKQRKVDHLSYVSQASLATRAVLLADKLHNLTTMHFDQQSGQKIWEHFNAPKEEVLWYLTSIVDVAANFPDKRLKQMASECRQRLVDLDSSDG